MFLKLTQKYSKNTSYLRDFSTLTGGFTLIFILLVNFRFSDSYTVKCHNYEIFWSELSKILKTYVKVCFAVEML